MATIRCLIDDVHVDCDSLCDRASMKPSIGIMFFVVGLFFVLFVTPILMKKIYYIMISPRPRGTTTQAVQCNMDKVVHHITIHPDNTIAMSTSDNTHIDLV